MKYEGTIFGGIFIIIAIVTGYVSFYIITGDFTTIIGVISGTYSPVFFGIKIIVGVLFGIISLISGLFGVNLIVAERTGESR